MEFENEFENIEKEIQAGDRINKYTSDWSVYQHIEHMLLANSRMFDIIIEDKEPEPKKPVTLLGYVILFLGFMPRGKGQSPKEFEVGNAIGREELCALLSRTKDKYSAINFDKALNSKKTVGIHPYFGGLNPSQWLQLSKIHTRHHLKIIRDIKQRFKNSSN